MGDEKYSFSVTNSRTEHQQERLELLLQKH